MGITAYLDHYCERVSPNYWSEPFNLFSNIAFLLVAFFLYRKLSKNNSSQNASKIDIWALVTLIPLIGFGSALWHLLAVHWALWADRIPILVFISIFLLSSLVRVFNLSLLISFFVFGLFQLINILVQINFSPAILNGSLFYVPTAISLFIITSLLWVKNLTTTAYYFISGLIVFIIAITFRSVDLSICKSFPAGTHFIWHFLVAFTIYLLMSGLINYSSTAKKNEP